MGFLMVLGHQYDLILIKLYFGVNLKFKLMQEKQHNTTQHTANTVLPSSSVSSTTV